MQSRFFKQFIYGVFYLAIIFGVGYGIYITTLKPAPSCSDNKQNQGEQGIDCGGPCQTCTLKEVKPIFFSPVSIFGVDADHISVLVELQNPNTKYGAEFNYAINFYDQNGLVLASLEQNSFIYPGEIKVMIEPGIEVKSADVLRATIEAKNFNWRPANIFSLPKTQTRDIRVELQIKEKRATVSGLLVNPNAFDLRKAVINVVVLDQFGVRRAVSRTAIEDVGSFSEKNFSVLVPGITATELDPDAIKISVEPKR